LLAHGRWFSPGTPASSTTNTGRHDIAEILLKVALKHQKSNKFFLSIFMQSVPITDTTDVVSSNLDQGEVYNIMR